MDLQHVERARVYMQKLAQGINPLDDSPVPEQELINHVRLSRCFFFVADVLGQVLAEETAAEQLQETWKAMFSSFGIAPEKEPVSTGS